MTLTRLRTSAQCSIMVTSRSCWVVLSSSRRPPFNVPFIHLLHLSPPLMHTWCSLQDVRVAYRSMAACLYVLETLTHLHSCGDNTIILYHLRDGEMGIS